MISVRPARDGAPLRVALLANRRARRLQGRVGWRALSEAARGLPVEAPAGLTELPAALDRLLATTPDVLVVAGGDGTLHHAINGLLRVTDRPPPVLALSGGTLNIVARTARVRHSPATTLRTFRRTWGDGRRGLSTRAVPLLRVERQGGPPRHGFVLGTETLFHAIELYGEFGAGYGGLARFLLELARGALLGSELWRREGWKLGPHLGALEVDERTWPRYLAAVASTVDLTLAHFAVHAIRRRPDARGMHVKVVEPAEPGEVVRRVPGLLFERDVRGVVDVPEARHLSFRGPYTLDGEVIPLTPGADERASVRIAAAPLRLVCP